MLRIAPASPVLWRSPTTVQFGSVADTIVTVTHAWQLRLLRELHNGVPPSAFPALARALDAPADAALVFLEQVRPALEVRAGSPVTDIALLHPLDDRTGVDQVAGGLELAGLRVALITDDTLDGWHGPVAVIAHHVLDPRRVASLMSDDTVHVPLVLGYEGAVVGPLVVPGRTPCTTCMTHTRIDADPAWPAIAGQLLGRAPAPVDVAVATEAGITAARLVRDQATMPPESASVSLTISPRSARRIPTTYHRHSACGCRSLGGIATVDDLSSRVPTTPREYARPA